jgi:DNA primase
MGTSLTEDQLRELGRLASTLTLCFDADAAGEEAALRGVRAALARDLRVRIVPLPAGRDPADLLADGREAFEHALEAAQTVLAFEVGRVLDRHGELGIDDTYAAARTVLAAAPATPERDEQVRRVASALRLDPETQAALVRPAGRTATPARSAARVRRRLDAHARLEREFLAAALALPGRGRALLSGEDVSGLLEQPEHAALLPWLRQRLDGGAAPPPPGLEPVAAEVVASAARYGLDGERAGPEEEGEQDRVLEHLWLRLQLHHLERRMTPLKEMLDSDDYSREGEQELSNLARAAEAIRHRMRAGGG